MVLAAHYHGGMLDWIETADPLLTEEQADLRKKAVEFARRALHTDMVTQDRHARFDAEGWKQCAGFGLFTMPLAPEHGGLGLSLSSVIAVMEGLGYAASDQGLLFSLNAHLWTTVLPLARFGTEEQRRRFLPGLLDGSRIGANATTEAEAGSDVVAMHTRVERQGEEYVLNGSKLFITNAPVADVFVVYATLGREMGAMGVTAFLVEKDTPGLVVGRPTDKMGLKTSPMAELSFEDCRIPVGNRLGREGRGLDVFGHAMEWERGCILANCLGALQRQLERCIHHARQRKQFGQAIGKFQSVANLIVGMKVRLDTCRPLVYRVGWLKDRGLPAALEASLAKLHVSESYVQSCLDAIQVFGGYGYMTEQQIERDLRDAVGSTLYSGTSEIQKNLIARGLGL